MVEKILGKILSDHYIIKVYYKNLSPIEGHLIFPHHISVDYFSGLIPQPAPGDPFHTFPSCGFNYPQLDSTWSPCYQYQSTAHGRRFKLHHHAVIKLHSQHVLIGKQTSLVAKQLSWRTTKFVCSPNNYHNPRPCLLLTKSIGATLFYMLLFLQLATM